MNTTKIILASLALSGLILGGCGDDGGGGDTSPGDSSMPDTTTGDTSPGDTSVGDTAMDTSVPADCTRYCDAMDTNCSGANAQYADRAECEAICAASTWPVGTVGEMAGNTIECRIYHANFATESGDAATHCPHAGASGAQVCGGVNYRTETADMYTRVDRIGMPAVSTALISSGTKNAYNDDDPAGDVVGGGAYAGEIVATLDALHTALDDDLAGVPLTPCSMTMMVGGLPACVGQEIIPSSGITPASLVIPDTIQVDGTGTAGFPNGRMLADPVIDVTLAILLLDMTTTGQSPTTLADLPLNPAMNDATFGTTFPYLAPAHTP